MEQLLDLEPKIKDQSRWLQCCQSKMAENGGYLFRKPYRYNATDQALNAKLRM